MGLLQDNRDKQTILGAMSDVGADPLEWRKKAGLMQGLGRLFGSYTVDEIKGVLDVGSKGMSGEPVTMEDNLTLLGGLIDAAVPLSIGSGLMHGVKPNVVNSVTSVLPWPKNFPKAFNHTSIGAMKKHPGYKKAKSGDLESAARLVSDLIKPGKAEQIKKTVPGGLLVYPHAVELSGKNKIPGVMSGAIHEITGLPVDDSIVQVSKAFRTGGDAAQKMISRPEFSGDVVKNQDYILVDDVLAQGGTMSELRHFIENAGGKVKAVSPLTLARGSSTLNIQDNTINELIGRFSQNGLEKLLQEFNISGTIPALTEREGRYLSRFNSLDSIRNRLTQARQERNKRLRESILQETSNQEVIPFADPYSGGQQ